MWFSETPWFPCQTTSTIICPFTWFQFSLPQSMFQVRISMSGSWTLNGKVRPWFCRETKSLEGWQGTACHTVIPHQDPENYRTSWPSTVGSTSSRWQGQMTTHHIMVNHCCECSVEECDLGVSRSLGCHRKTRIYGGNFLPPPCFTLFPSRRVIVSQLLELEQIPEPTI